MRNDPNGFLYEINAYVFLNRLSKELKRKITLRNIPVKYWRDLKRQGFQYVWFMGVWQRSPASREVSLTDEKFREEYIQVLGKWSKEDVTGSPYAVSQYEPDERIGTLEDLKTLRKKLNALGLKLILDFVPNHTGLDHPWSKEYPQRYICVDTKYFENHDQADFYKTAKDTYVAYGKDPYFPSWKDTLQLNYASPETREALIETLLRIGSCCDGLRCDMAMLVMNRIFQQTWSHLLHDTKMPEEEFWVTAIKSVKAKFPDFVFIAESYWDLEWELQQMGFDYTYDKRLYDRLVRSSADDIRGHLRADEEYQQKSLRFIENHDEPRILSLVPPERAQAAAVVAATVPGLKLIFDGQMEGKKIRIPVHLGVEPKEDINPKNTVFYQQLMKFINDGVLINGDWQLVDVRKAWEGNESFHNILAWQWSFRSEIKIVIVNFSDTESQARIFWPDLKTQGEALTFSDQSQQEVYERETDELREHGLYVSLPPWKSHWFSIKESKTVEPEKEKVLA